jgi:hypothetical protein
MNVEIGAEVALFPEKEYINGIAVAVRSFPVWLLPSTALTSGDDCLCTHKSVLVTWSGADLRAALYQVRNCLHASLHAPHFCPLGRVLYRIIHPHLSMKETLPLVRYFAENNKKMPIVILTGWNGKKTAQYLCQYGGNP